MTQQLTRVEDLIRRFKTPTDVLALEAERWGSTLEEKVASDEAIARDRALVEVDKDHQQALQVAADAKQASLDAYIRRLPLHVRVFYEDTRAADDKLRKEENPKLGYENFPQRGKPLAESYLKYCCGEEPDGGCREEESDDDAN